MRFTNTTGCSVIGCSVVGCSLCEGRPALRDAIGRHGALWDGRPTLWDGRSTLFEGRPALRDAIGRHMLFLAPETVSELILSFEAW